ncbi:DNA-directed RNA polymerase V subunit 1-like [Lolium rigidum]|uniref:DNA-directed RNA polymerase V subunit 1-like n=1 Tax=Lolium rigidum TaxID=89674 RepID=UPI001F5C869D|nr:DNA-directed RNA polymerase V subunit 1-like [Lolium rigidum]
MALSREAAPGAGRREFVTDVDPHTNIVAESERRLAVHGVIPVFGELKPALTTADAARLFAEHFGTTASAVRVTSHGPCEFLLFFTDAAKAMSKTLPFKVRVYLESVPEHAHDVVSVSPLFAGKAMVDFQVNKLAMEEDQSAVLVAEGSIKSIKLSLSTEAEICTYSINDCPVTHPSQLGNPFLGLPLESGKCESCGASENGKCEGHFGYIELPVPIYHPCHVSELRQLLTLVCLKCRRMKKAKGKQSNGKENVSVTACHYADCRALPALSVKETKTTDGVRLELKASPKKHMTERSWNFLDQYGFHYGGASHNRILLPEEALNILKKIPDETKKKLAARGYIAQSGYVMKYLPVPPNCLYIPEFTDGQSIMSYDISISLLKKVLQKIEQIKKSRAGPPNFKSHDVESSDLQLSIGQYIQLRGTTKGPQDAKRYAISTDSSHLSTKQWLDKMRTLFISKGSGFSSRSVLTGDPYIGVDVVGLPSEVAKRITFEEQVTDININRLQEVVDKGDCLTYRDGETTYAITVGSKGYTTLKVGQTISRRIVDGDVVFLNRPPSTHKHSLQAFKVYIHDDHTVKINPLICSPLAADFDGDCVHIYYPQSLAAKAEALELFSVEKQLTNSHNGKINLQLANDSLLALKHMSSRTMLSKESANQLAMLLSLSLPAPAVVKSKPYWTISQILQSALPAELTCEGDRFLVKDSTVVKLDLAKESVQASFSDLVSSINCVKGPGDALKFLNALQPLLMEFLLLDGFSVSLQDFSVPKILLEEAQESIKKQSAVLEQSRSSKGQYVEMRVDNNLKDVKQQISDFVVKSSHLGLLIDPKSDPSVSKVVQQLGFVGLQLYREGKFYSSRLVEDCFSNFVNRHPPVGNEVQHPPEAYGLVQSSYFHGLNPYEELVHAISTRETIVRSSRGLTEPGTLFKSLMAILRDVVVCYDGTVRNICSNSIMQLKYREEDATDFPSDITPGEPVGVLAATAISNPAYKAVLDASQSNNTSWELMKEILQTKVNYKNDTKDRKVILFLNDCSCPKKFCKEKAAIAVQGCLKKVTLEDCATDICIEYQKQTSLDGISEATPAFVGHIHLQKAHLETINISTEDILHKCQEVSVKHGMKKGHLAHLFKKITFSTCDCSFTQKPIDGKVPCLQFSFSEDIPMLSESVEKAVNVLADSICGVLLDTIIKGDPRIQEAKITWVGSDATSWVKHTKKASKGEPAVEIVVEKGEALQNGDAWGIAMDACIPVMNLIDTRRSIPYGIQQVRKLLGIACSFDQVVQRLSTTMKTVAKGILKDHLVLVANSMTCTGNLNGFNNAGYKATFRSLKVQVPFTESTLFTPMKCFEKAAEKCHSDSLGCVVSSCSWGKHAALGTGSSFEILWNENQLKSNKEYGDGLYDFLALVRTDQEKARYTFLDDVDYLIEDNALSPELDGMPTFDDCLEEQPTDQGNSSWNVPATVENESADWGGWGAEKAKDKKTMPEEPAGLNTWADQSAKKDTDGGGRNWGSNQQIKIHLGMCLRQWRMNQLIGGALKRRRIRGLCQKNQLDSILGLIRVLRRIQMEVVVTGGSNQQIKIHLGMCLRQWRMNQLIGGAGAVKREWIRRVFQKNQLKSTLGLIRVLKRIQMEVVVTGNSDGGDGTWEKQASSCKKNVDQASWGNEPVPPSRNTWDDKASKPHTDAHNDSWGSVAANTRTCTAKDVPWGSTQTSSAEHMDAQNDSWENVAAKAASLSDNAWNAAPVSQGNENSEAKEPDAWDGWGFAQAKDSSTDDLNKSDASNNSKGWKSDGWAAKESRRDQRDNLGRPPMRPVERPPRPRFELPADAKTILHEIEPIVLSVRKIFRESCDGVNLSLEDEKFIKEKILEHHPEKDKKLSSETDHIVVNKHHTFQESRCFYVVSSDGTQTDFSYIKCLDNYVRKSYAEEPAELVSQMYFQRRNRDRAPAEASQPTLAETSQATPQEAQLETPAPLAETASQEALASPSATQQETPAATPQETPAATETAPAATPQETLAATVNKWAEKPDSDSAWGAGASDDKWA